MGDVVIRNGTIVDGTGRPGFRGDVVIRDGRVAAVGSVSPADRPAGATEIDASGLLVTPGWVDIHSHYDGQVTWDEELAPSSGHGVTTTVMGNCGVGFAPAAPERRDWLIALMEGVEDIPGTALAEGIDWSWESFPQYLDALGQRQWTMDVGTQIAHGAVRAYVMGDRGARNEPATPDDIAAMRAVVREAVAAGALGFSTSRTLVHRALDGEPVPGTFAAEDELFGIGSALGDLGTGIFELAPLGAAGEDIVNPVREVDWMVRLSAAIRRPVTFGLLQVDPAPELWRELMAASLAAIETGADVWPQVAGRATGVLSGPHTTFCYLNPIPAWRSLKARGLGPDELIAAMRDPLVRSQVVGWQPDEETAKRLQVAAERTYVLADPVDYEPGPERTLAAIAAASGRTPVEAAYDIMLEHDRECVIYLPALNYSHGSLEPAREMLLHPRSVSGLADGGAHCLTICDASMPTFMLTHWTRDRTRGSRLPVEFVVKKQTQDTARLYGLGDRGALAPGLLGDVNVIDYDNLRLDLPRVVSDLPAGGSRLLQRADGYVATVKSGVVTFADGVATGARPGRLLRGAR